MYDIKKRPLGIYEKALPNDFTWLQKMQAAKQAGFDYIEISIDESDERLARLDWSDEQIEEIRSYMKETGIIIPSLEAKTKKQETEHLRSWRKQFFCHRN